ncbi:MAG: outer membrane protein assembly factor BamB [Sutterellaceae bacterium]|nr:outer membrane protein assembly factor BamB [Sutterellaceae bacterium]
MNIKLKLAACAVAGAVALALSGCSSTSSHEPADLVDIQTSVRADEVWSRSLGESTTGLLTPIVTSNGIYAAGGDRLYRIDPTNGKVEWEVETGADIAAGVGSDGQYVAVGTVKGEVEVYGNDGKRLWTVRLTSEMSVPPLVGSGFVIVRTTDTRITAFDAMTAERRWRYQSQVPALTVRAASQMRFSPAGVLVGQANGRLLALDGNGRTVFDAVVAQAKGITEVERLVDVVGSPLVDARMMCAAAFQGGILCMDSKNGRPLWRAQVDAVTGPVTDGTHVYVVTARGEINAYDYETGKLVWSNGALLWRDPSAPVVMGDMLAVGDYDGVIHFIDPASGEFVGRTSVSGAVRVPPISMGDGALFQTEEGEIAYIRAQK